MSLFKTYSPKLLWTLNLRLLNAIFRHPPKMNIEPESYFQAVLDAHRFIRTDLNGTFVSPQIQTNEPTTIVNIHRSLQELENILFGPTEHPFPSTIEGCCLYTHYLEQQLNPTKHRCVLF
jgi:hypothetical protein